jgi:hypothetical protein
MTVIAANLQGLYTKHAFNARAQALTGEGTPEDKHFVKEGTKGVVPTDADSAILVEGTGAVQVAPDFGFRVSRLEFINTSAAGTTVSIFTGEDCEAATLRGVVKVAASAGFDGEEPSANGLDPELFPGLMKDNGPNYYFDLPKGQTIFLTCPDDEVVKANIELYDYKV